MNQGVPDAGIGAALFSAASVFMAYKGFQLLTYDYEDLTNPRMTLPRTETTTPMFKALVLLLM